MDTCFTNNPVISPGTTDHIDARKNVAVHLVPARNLSVTPSNNPSRCYFCVLPASEAHTENVCDRQDLTEYEAKCFVSLRRCAAVVLFVFFINLGITIWVNVAGNVATADFILDLITCIPILMQVRFSIMISVTDKGLQLGWIQALRLIIFFFLLMNVVRLYVKVQQVSGGAYCAERACCA